MGEELPADVHSRSSPPSPRSTLRSLRTEILKRLQDEWDAFQREFEDFAAKAEQEIGAVQRRESNSVASEEEPSIVNDDDANDQSIVTINDHHLRPPPFVDKISTTGDHLNVNGTGAGTVELVNVHLEIDFTDDDGTGDIDHLEWCNGRINSLLRLLGVLETEKELVLASIVITSAEKADDHSASNNNSIKGNNVPAVIAAAKSDWSEEESSQRWRINDIEAEWKNEAPYPYVTVTTDPETLYGMTDEYVCSRFISKEVVKERRRIRWDMRSRRKQLLQQKAKLAISQNGKPQELPQHKRKRRKSAPNSTTNKSMKLGDDSGGKLKKKDERYQLRRRISN